MTSPATPENPKTPQSSPATPENPKASRSSAAPRTAATTPPVSAPPTAPDEVGELERAADAASEATEIAAALVVSGTETEAGTEPEPGPETGLAATVADAAGQFRAVNDNLLATAKLTGTLTLDTYENTLRTLLALEERVGTLGGPGWIGELTRAHVALVTSVSSPVFSAARHALQ
ncbi:hypothetical protein [Rhodococcus sp. DMU1]|uniref:hypothetical protein n=1 Tax=Rhodococcus sp. DMU1 TaxID=2722825 RepID=UPI00143E5E43|nr:hypothetical protein [Rhodococcus sp. DMU1]QIX53937.1 hypothetical protein HFP48_30790 [Rhodococcus sp. DMU1]